MYWNYLVILICVLAFIFSVIKEYRRKNKQRLWLRVVASIVAIAALAALTLPITYWSETSRNDNEAVLLTAGFNADSLTKYKNDSVYTFNDTIKQLYPKAKLITVSQLKNITPTLSAVHLLGYGLSPDELSQINNVSVIFHPAPVPYGITSANWPEKLKQGQHFVVQGKFNHTNGNPVRLVLKELNTTTDSTTVEHEGIESFQLTSLPKNTGKIINRLIAIAGKDTLENEPLPFLIEPIIHIKVLVLTSSPGFESKFLKNWLSEQGFEVAVRSTISKDKISTQFVNTPQVPLTQLSASVPDKFDVLISDLAALISLNQTESASLKQQVSQNGLGLIIKADTVFKTPVLLQNDFSIYQPADKDQPLSPQIQNAKLTAKIPITGQQFITDKEDMQTLASDAQHRVLAAMTISGTGKVVCTTLNETYKWMLAGDKDDYSAYWSLLIAKAAKSAPQSENWSVVTPFPTVNARITIQLQTATQPGAILMDNERASPIQNALSPFQWQSSWWPLWPGWHIIKHTAGSVEKPVYVYDKNDWADIKAVNKIIATQKYASDSTLSGVTKQIHGKVRIPVSKAYFYALLLLCCAFLWAEGKMAPK